MPITLKSHAQSIVFRDFMKNEDEGDLIFFLFRFFTCDIYPSFTNVKKRFVNYLEKLLICTHFTMSYIKNR